MSFKPKKGIQELVNRLNAWRRNRMLVGGLVMDLAVVSREKTHASSPSTSGKTYEKTSVIHTRPEQFDVLISS